MLSTHLTHFPFRNPTQDGIELQVLSACQQVIDSIKLRAIAHVLMYFIYFPEYTENKKNNC